MMSGDNQEPAENKGSLFLIRFSALVQNITNRCFEWCKLLILQCPIFGDSLKSDFFAPELANKR
jgi:hypothetical protein